MKSSIAWAFEIDCSTNRKQETILGSWAFNSREQLEKDMFEVSDVPDNYKPVRVKIIKHSDWLIIKKLLEKHGEKI